MFRDHAPFCSVIALVFGLGGFTYEVMRENLEAATLALRTKERDEERARNLAVEAQLASLESHVRPHFLFNTLNSISALIPEDPARAEVLVGKLAAVLRLSLDSNQRSLCRIETELKLVRDYLEIERARFGDRLQFEIDVPRALYSSEVPVFSLQTLVENSVKYAVSPRLSTTRIRLTAREEEGSLFFEVSDNGPGFTAAAIQSGHGLDNLKSRLANLFGASGRLEVATEGGLTTVSMILPRPRAVAAD